MYVSLFQWNILPTSIFCDLYNLDEDSILTGKNLGLRVLRQIFIWSLLLKFMLLFGVALTSKIV